MKIAVVIPTFERAYKLNRLLDSLDKQTFKDFDVHIYHDNRDYETATMVDRAKHDSYRIIQLVNGQQEFVIGSWNKFFKSMFDEYSILNYQAVQWLVDDVALYPDFLEKAVGALYEHFPDTDGVIGTRQECPGYSNYTFKWFGQSLLGRKFIERYKDVDYQVCCPYYKHFYQDEEMWQFACSLEKFRNCPEALLKHYHPAFDKAELDSTHPLVRGTVMGEDRAIYAERKRLNLVWGQSWK